MGGQTRFHTEKDLEVSQEAQQEQVGLKGSLGGETSRGENICVVWPETRWEFSPLSKCWPGGSSVRAKGQPGLSISAEASVGQMMAVKDEMPSADVMMLREPQKLGNH